MGRKLLEMPVESSLAAMVRVVEALGVAADDVRVEPVAASWDREAALALVVATEPAVTTWADGLPEAGIERGKAVAAALLESIAAAEEELPGRGRNQRGPSQGRGPTAAAKIDMVPGVPLPAEAGDLAGLIPTRTVVDADTWEAMQDAIDAPLDEARQDQLRRVLHSPTVLHPAPPAHPDIIVDDLPDPDDAAVDEPPGAAPFPPLSPDQVAAVVNGDVPKRTRRAKATAEIVKPPAFPSAPIERRRETAAPIGREGPDANWLPNEQMLGCQDTGCTWYTGKEADLIAHVAIVHGGRKPTQDELNPLGATARAQRLAHHDPNRGIA